MTISWVLGTLMLWIPATVSLCRAGTFPVAFSEVTSLLCLLLAYASLAGLGFFVGAFTVYRLVVRVCRHINGAPFTAGDHAIILTGPRTGTVARVDEVTRGQGGDLLARLDFGAEARDRHLDIFNDYMLLRHSG